MVCTVAAGTSAEYYIDEQAEYYAGGRESRGRWYMPSGMSGLNDGAEIEVEQFRKFHSGLDLDGHPFSRSTDSGRADRVAGYDLTFSAPKSVSVLWAVCKPDVRAEIEAAQEQAVRLTLDLLNRHAAYARRGKGGAELEKVSMFGVLFAHGESRPVKRDDGTALADPQLHTHAVIMNLAERADGTWGALDGRHLFQWKMAAGALYRAELASQLQRRLGVEIERTDDTGLFEVRGVPDEIRRHFSARRAEIESMMEPYGRVTAEAQALAAAVALGSRKVKSQSGEDRAEQLERWQAEAARRGFAEPQIAASLNRACDPLHVAEEEHAFRQATDELVRRLTEHESTFNAAELHAAIAAVCVGRNQDISQVVATIERLESENQIVELERDGFGQPIYSTPEMIRVEQELQGFARDGANSFRHRLSAMKIEQVVAETSLSEEQQVAVRAAVTGADIAVVEGAAGAGKSYAMNSVVHLYQSERYRVTGTATAWKLANRMADEYGIESRATDAWLAAARRGERFLDARTVLVVDEAGQLSSRQMHQILVAARDSGAKVILTGDQQQLQAVGAGPGLRIVAEQVGAARIDTIVRQREQWARDAASAFAVGRAEEGFAAYRDRSLLRWHEGKAETIRAAVEDWKEFAHANPGATALILARTNADVRALNLEIREYLRDREVIASEDVQIAARVPARGQALTSFAVGDQIRFGMRKDALSVINGTIGRVLRVSPDGPGHAEIVAEIDGRAVAFNTRDITDSDGRVHMDHAYAATIYSSQGATVEAAFVVADSAMRRNDIYVAASRARGTTTLYLDRNAVEASVRSRLPLLDRARAAIHMPELETFLVQAWARAQVKSCTLDYSDAETSTQSRNANARETGTIEREAQLSRSDESLHGEHRASNPTASPAGDQRPEQCPPSSAPRSRIISSISALANSLKHRDFERE